MNPTAYRLAFETVAQWIDSVSAGLKQAAMGSLTIPLIVLGVAFLMMIFDATRRVRSWH